MFLCVYAHMDAEYAYLCMHVRIEVNFECSLLSLSTFFIVIIILSLRLSLSQILEPIDSVRWLVSKPLGPYLPRAGITRTSHCAWLFPRVLGTLRSSHLCNKHSVNGAMSPALSASLEKQRLNYFIFKETVRSMFTFWKVASYVKRKRWDILGGQKEAQKKH